jgi:DNA-binding NarL/FixJ family response regulator
MTIRVLIADDQHLVRAGFRGLLERGADIEVVGEAADGTTAVQMVRATRPDVVLMDIRMPGIDGIAATRAITTDQPEVHVLVLTTFELDEYVAEALRAGASGFLGKDVEPATLREAIRLVAAGEALLSPRVTRHLIARFLAQSDPPPERAEMLAGLSEREREVVALVAEGLSNSDIGQHLHLSSATVRTHVGRAMAKLDVHDRAQLVILAFRSGLVRP